MMRSEIRRASNSSRIKYFSHAKNKLKLANKSNNTNSTVDLPLLPPPPPTIDLPPPVLSTNLLNKKQSLKNDSSSLILNDLIDQLDTGSLLRQELRRRRIHIPPESTLQLSSQVSRPNIFPNIFNQGDGFIVDAVIEWPITLDLQKLADALIEPNRRKPKPKPWPQTKPTAVNSTTSKVHRFNNEDYFEEDFAAEEEEGRSLSTDRGIVGFERCFIYEKLEIGLSKTLQLNRNQSKDCMLRGICEVQWLANSYPVEAQLSVFFEMIHLLLKPSLGAEDECYEDYLEAENAAFEGPTYCSQFVPRCPLNIAGLFARNLIKDVIF